MQEGHLAQADGGPGNHQEASRKRESVCDFCQNVCVGAGGVEDSLRENDKSMFIEPNNCQALLLCTSYLREFAQTLIPAL